MTIIFTILILGAVALMIIMLLGKFRYTIKLKDTELKHGNALGKPCFSTLELGLRFFVDS
jgi:hypothetical protein